VATTGPEPRAGGQPDLNPCKRIAVESESYKRERGGRGPAGKDKVDFRWLDYFWWPQTGRRI
jgi:hypothetical protein